MSDIEPFAGIGDLAVPDIQTLAVDTANQLQKIWDSVGIKCLFYLIIRWNLIYIQKRNITENVKSITFSFLN